MGSTLCICIFSQAVHRYSRNLKMQMQRVDPMQMQRVDPKKAPKRWRGEPPPFHL